MRQEASAADMIQLISVEIVELYVVLDHVVACWIRRYSPDHIVRNYHQYTCLNTANRRAGVCIERVRASASFNAHELYCSISKPVRGGAAAGIVSKVIAYLHCGRHGRRRTPGYRARVEVRRLDSLIDAVRAWRGWSRGRVTFSSSTSRCDLGRSSIQGTGLRNPGRLRSSCGALWNHNHR